MTKTLQVAALIHDQAMRHPGVPYAMCTNGICKAQAERVALQIIEALDIDVLCG